MTPHDEYTTYHYQKENTWRLDQPSRKGGEEGRKVGALPTMFRTLSESGNVVTKDGLKSSPQRPARTLEPKKRGSSDSWKQHFVKNPFRVIVHFLPFLSFTNYLTFIQGEGTYFLV